MLERSSVRLPMNSDASPASTACRRSFLQHRQARPGFAHRAGSESEMKNHLSQRNFNPTNFHQIQSYYNLSPLLFYRRPLSFEFWLPDQMPKHL